MVFVCEFMSVLNLTLNMMNLSLKYKNLAIGSYGIYFTGGLLLLIQPRLLASTFAQQVTCTFHHCARL